jgi:cytochrome c oxidase subunit 2
MPIHVKVVTTEQYSAWVQERQKEAAAKADDPSKVWQQADLVARGEKVYAANCAACHQASGKGAGPIKALDGSAIVLDADHLKTTNILLKKRKHTPARPIPGGGISFDRSLDSRCHLV